MRFAAPVALLMAGLLASASASADNGAGPTAPPLAAAPPPDATPAVAPSFTAPPVAPPATPMAPAYPTPQAYAPGYPPPYMMYPYAPPGAGAPPPYWMPIAGPTERRSNAMRTTGIVLFAAGGVTTAIGGVIFAAVATTGCQDQVILDDFQPRPSPAASSERVRSAHQALNGCDTSPGVGLGILTAGLVTAVVGIPLFVIGSKQVPARTTTGKLVPELRVGAANGSLRWTF